MEDKVNQSDNEAVCADVKDAARNDRKSEGQESYFRMNSAYARFDHFYMLHFLKEAGAVPICVVLKKAIFRAAKPIH